MIELVVAALIQLGTLTSSAPVESQAATESTTTTTTPPGGTGSWDDGN